MLDDLDNVVISEVNGCGIVNYIIRVKSMDGNYSFILKYGETYARVSTKFKKKYWHCLEPLIMLTCHLMKTCFKRVFTIEFFFYYYLNNRNFHNFCQNKVNILEPFFRKRLDSD